MSPLHPITRASAKPWPKLCCVGTIIGVVAGAHLDRSSESNTWRIWVDHQHQLMDHAFRNCRTYKSKGACKGDIYT